MLDRRVISIATIQSAIGSNGEISGDFSEEDLRYMVSTFNAGSLPAQLEDEPISEHTVGPQLGQDNLRRGLYACAFGLVIVGIFLISYYYLAGVVAMVAVLMNIVLILGVLAMFGATFTLPGIAGIVLTIGAAVDANVLIFERLREEQHAGLSLRMAMKYAYEHAASAIWDSNATTIITSIILMWLGSEEVKGFGTTLLVGLLSSLFTSLFVTRTIFNILIDTFHVKTLSSLPLTFPKWDKLLKPDIHWMDFAPIFWVISAAFIIAGAVAFVVKAHEHELADVDFASGTQVQFDLRQPMSLDEIRSAFEAAKNPALPAVNLTAVSSETNKPDSAYELVTANADAKAVRTAVLNVLGTRISTDLPSRFDHVNDAVDVAINSGIVQPITPGFTVKDLDNFKTSAADDYIGGRGGAEGPEPAAQAGSDPRPSGSSARHRGIQQRVRRLLAGLERIHRRFTAGTQRTDQLGGGLCLRPGLSVRQGPGQMDQQRRQSYLGTGEKRREPRGPLAEGEHLRTPGGRRQPAGGDVRPGSFLAGNHGVHLAAVR